MECTDRVVRAGRRSGAPLLLAAVATFLFFVPGALEALRYDRAAAVGGELWRVVTSQLVHASPAHLAWDVVATLILGLAVAARSPRRFLLIVGASALAIPLAVHLALPGLDTFCGLSGIASALFAAYAVTLAGTAVRERRWGLVAATGIVGIAFAAKLAFEAATGGAVFVDLDAVSLAPVPLAHVVGAAIGLAFSLGLPAAGAGSTAQVRGPGSGSALRPASGHHDRSR